MSPRLHQRNLSNFDALSGDDVRLLLAGARTLERAAQRGVANQPLRGKNLALLGTPADAPGLAAFREAATGLGAHVACIPAGGAGMGDAVALLGRLYDAVDCEGLDDALVERLQRQAGVPVYAGLAAPQHPLHALAVLMAVEQRSGKPLADTRACVVHPGADAPAVGALLRAAALAGLGLCVVAPPAAWPAAAATRRSRDAAQANGAGTSLVPPGGEDAARAAAQADVVLELDGAHAAEAGESWRYVLQSLLLASLA